MSDDTGSSGSSLPFFFPFPNHPFFAFPGEGAPCAAFAFMRSSSGFTGVKIRFVPKWQGVRRESAAGPGKSAYLCLPQCTPRIARLPNPKPDDGRHRHGDSY